MQTDLRYTPDHTTSCVKMENTDVELGQQLKEVGKKPLHPPDTVDELLPVLHQVERLLSKLIVSSFEDLANQSSQSYFKRASILETVSKVQSCVIMLDLECDDMIVEMFEHFLRSGVLPIAQKLGEDLLKKYAEKLKPYLIPALTALEAKKIESEDEKDNDVKESAISAPVQLETKKDNDDVQVSSPKAIETKSVTANVSSSSQSDSLPDASRIKNVVHSKRKQEVKLPDTIDLSEDDDVASDSDEEPPLKVSKKLNLLISGQSQNNQGKKVGAEDSDAKQAKQSVKKSYVKKPKQTGKTSKQSAKKAKDSVLDSEPLKSVKKVEKRKRTVEEEDSDSDAKPLKLSAKKGMQKDEAKTLSNDDEMDVSPKSTKKPAKWEGNKKILQAPVQNASIHQLKIKNLILKNMTKAWLGKRSKFGGLKIKCISKVLLSQLMLLKKHKVSYVDGDEENLYLRNQRWAIIQNFSTRHKDEIAEFESEEASPEVHKKKKSKPDHAPYASQEENKDSSKTSKASGSKDKKSKAGKSKEAEVTPKTSTKTKQETSKSVNKSNGKPLKVEANQMVQTRPKNLRVLLKLLKKVGQRNERNR
nr:hypothetical protein [Tanacetum cinerariifolium]